VYSDAFEVWCIL